MAKDPQALVKYNGKSLYFVEGLRLLPGNNSLPAVEWERAKAANARLRYRLQEGIIEELPGEGELPTGEPAALKMVAETVDKELLEQWEESEKRPKVAKSIADRLKAIAPSPKPEPPKEGKGNE
jgi:hypothetical protein